MRHLRLFLNALLEINVIDAGPLTCSNSSTPAGAAPLPSTSGIKAAYIKKRGSFPVEVNTSFIEEKPLKDLSFESVQTYQVFHLPERVCPSSPAVFMLCHRGGA